MLDTKSDLDYRAFAGDFPSSGTVTAVRENGSLADIGTGTYLGAGWVMTAAHVVAGMRPSVIFRVGGLIYSADLSTLALHPAYTSAEISTSDIAVFRLTLNPPIEPAVIYDGGTILGRSIAMVGNGSSGVGSSGYGPLSRLGIMRAGTNVIDGGSHGGTIIYADFDAPVGQTYIGGGSGYANNGITPLEALSAPGDSGGGWFVESSAGWALVGVASGVEIHSGYSYGHYGDVSFATAVEPYTSWLSQIGVPIVYSSAVPEASTLLLLSLGVVVILASKRSYIGRAARAIGRKLLLTLPVAISAVMVGGCSPSPPIDVEAMALFGKPFAFTIKNVGDDSVVIEAILLNGEKHLTRVIHRHPPLESVVGLELQSGESVTVDNTYLSVSVQDLTVQTNRGSRTFSFE